MEHARRREALLGFSTYPSNKTQLEHLDNFIPAERLSHLYKGLSAKVDRLPN